MDASYVETKRRVSSITVSFETFRYATVVGSANSSDADTVA
ncbi:unnamed protein product [Rhodiola kirilowii]